MDSKIEIRPGRIVNILIRRNPNAKATLFLIHGLGGRSEQWREQIPALEEQYSLIVPDLYGHGHSDKPEPNSTNPYSFAAINQDLLALFYRFATDNNILIGHSYGGALAASIALSCPDQVNKLILISPTPLAPNTAIPFLFKMPAPIMELMRPMLEKNFRKLAFDKAADPELIEHEVLISRNNPMYVIKGMLKGLKNTPDTDISKLKIPAMVLMGETDKLILPTVSENYYQNIPQHQFEMIQDAAHMSNLEQPLKVNALIEKFL